MQAKSPILYLRRKFDAFLREWKAREDHLPLIVKGARQVGKTETVRRFAGNEYRDFIEINFVERPEFKEIVRDGFSVDSIIRNISIIDPSLRFTPNETLLFFDEIPEVEPAKIVKHKEFELDRISDEQAVEQIELLDNSFYIYKDMETGNVNVLYRRADGDYGVIKTK